MYKKLVKFVVEKSHIKKEQTAMPFLKYIQDDEHYKEVLAMIANVRQHLWIGTADIKDLYVKPVNEKLFVAIELFEK